MLDDKGIVIMDIQSISVINIIMMTSENTKGIALNMQQKGSLSLKSFLTDVSRGPFTVDTVE